MAVVVVLVAALLMAVHTHALNDDGATGAVTQLQSWQRVEKTHGLTLQEARRLGVNSQDLYELGIKDVTERLAVLREIYGSSSSDSSEYQEFVFVAKHVNSTRQLGKCLNFIVKYRYTDGAAPNATGKGYIDYREIRDIALYYAKPTSDLPMNVQWEAINLALVRNISMRYPQITAVNAVIQVMNNLNPMLVEPGNHGSSVTHIKSDYIQDFESVSETWTHAFDYDCTTSSGPTDDINMN